MTELIGSCDINLEITYRNKRSLCEFNVTYENATFQQIMKEILNYFQLE